MLVQFGFEKSELEELGDRLAPAVTTGIELTVTNRELRMCYLVLWQVPEMFSTEEDFHIRLGFYTEQDVANAQSIADLLAPYFFALRAAEQAKQSAIVEAEARAREEGLRAGALSLTEALERERQRIGVSGCCAERSTDGGIRPSRH